MVTVLSHEVLRYLKLVLLCVVRKIVLQHQNFIVIICSFIFFNDLLTFRTSSSRHSSLVNGSCLNGFVFMLHIPQDYLLQYVALAYSQSDRV